MPLLIEQNIESELWSRCGLDQKTLAMISHEAAQITLANLYSNYIDSSDIEIEISLLFTDDKNIQILNRTWRGIDKPTNVLSFPSQKLDNNLPQGLLGDIAFAFETIQSEAQIQGKTFKDHLTHLFVHGLLHLIGYDHIHDAEAEAMEALEIAILAKMNIDNPYQSEPAKSEMEN